MATEKLIVKNFGPITEAELDLRKVTVLIGEQASGKSVLAKLVAICGHRFAPQKLTMQDFSNYQLDTFFRENSFFEFSGENYSVSFQEKLFKRKFKNEDVQEVIIKLQTADSKYFDLVSSVQSEKNFNALEQLENEMSYWERVISETINESTKLLHESCYIPTERISIPFIENIGFQRVDSQISKEASKAVYKFKRKYNSYKRSLKIIDLPPLNMAFHSEGGSDVIRKNDLAVQFSNSSSGIQSITPLIVVIEGSLLENKKHIFIVEEPELSLYPTTQKRLVEYLIEKCTQGDNRLIITTHSPYILTALNNCIQAKNVATLHPESLEEVNKLVPSQYQIAYEDVSAYYVGGGKVKSIMNKEFQMIDANALDDISNELGTVFDKLLDLKYQNQA